MSAFKLHTLNQKLWAIVAASFIVRVVLFFLLPNTPTNLAPDESAYSEIARRITTGESLDQFGRLSKTSQTLVFPAAMFVRIGLDPLSATRLSALMYGIATLTFIAFLISKVADNYINPVSENKKTLNLVLILFAIYSFLPSHLLWSILALRESTMEFWVVLIFGSIFLITHHSGRSNKWNYLVLIFSLFLLFNTRLQVSLLLVISLMISLPLVHKVKNVRKVFFVVAITSAFSFSSLFMQTYVEFKVVNLDAPAADAPAADAPAADAPAADATLCQKNGQVIVVKASNFLCEEVRKTTLEDVTRPDEFIVGQITAIPDRQEANQANASSAIQTLSCPFEDASEIKKIACLIWRAPYTTTTFLIRPIIGLDVTSRSSLFAAVENVLWSAGFIFIFYAIAKKRRVLHIKALLPSVFFFVLYCVGAGSYEGNMGTAFRHKSLILWVVLLLIFALAWRKPEEFLKKSRNNSQESAV
jgi:hypothetical protein